MIINSENRISKCVNESIPQITVPATDGVTQSNQNCCDPQMGLDVSGMITEKPNRTSEPNPPTSLRIPQEWMNKQHNALFLKLQKMKHLNAKLDKDFSHRSTSLRMGKINQNENANRAKRGSNLMVGL